MDYGMFTDQGNDMVDTLVQFAKAFQLPEPAVMGLMNNIAKDERFAEITDTAVREEVGCALGWYN
jgi:hypothetical protein